MRILFATEVLPFARISGGDLVSLSIVEALEELDCRVRVLGCLRRGARVPSDRDAVAVDSRPVETAGAGLMPVVWLGRSVLAGLPYTSAKFHSRSFGTLVREALRNERFDLVIVDHTQLAWLLPWIPPPVPIVFVLHNAESRSYAVQAAQQPDWIRRFVYARESRRLRAMEEAIASSRARIWLLNGDDDLATAASRTVLPVIPRASDNCPPNDFRFDVGLLGTWSWFPNAAGLRWFFESVWKRLPSDFRIQVAGSGAETIGGKRDNVGYPGFVEDAASFMRSGRVFAIPTRFGSGIETKTLMAIQTGCSVVGSTASVRGLGALPATVAVADDPEGFAAALVEAARRPKNRAEQEEARRWSEGRRQAFLDVLREEISRIREMKVRNVAVAAPATVGLS